MNWLFKCLQVLFLIKICFSISSILTKNQVSYLFIFYATICTELFNRQKLIFELIEVFFYLLHQSSTLTITLACYSLYVLRIDAYPLIIQFHTLSIPLIQLCYTSDVQKIFCNLVIIFHTYLLAFYVHLRHLCRFWTYGTLVTFSLVKCFVNFALIIQNVVATD